MKNDLIWNATGLSAMDVTGADAEQFLQQQLANDVARVMPGQGQLSALHSPRGRVIAVFRVLARDEGYRLIMPATMTEAVLAYLARYVLRAKVGLEIRTAAEAGVWMLAGRDAVAGLEEAGLAAPPSPLAVAGDAELAVLGLAGPDNAFLLVGSRESWQRVGQGPPDPDPLTDTAAWELSRIRAGEGDVFPDTREQFLPQMLNLDLLGALSFTKGCYPGQEVIARTQNLGRIKRRMFGFSAAAPAPGPGARIMAQEEPAGLVVRCASNGDTLEGLAVLRLDFIHGTLTLETADGPALDLRPLPYALPDQAVT